MHLYEEITRQIVEAIERGTDQVVMPWHGKSAFPSNPISGTHYQGINTIILWAIGEHRLYGDSRWATYNQWQSKGAQVRKGERGVSILFYQKRENEDEDKPSFIARAYTVFNVVQVDGFHESLPATFHPLIEAERFVQSTGATISYGGSMAAYLPKEDRIVMPDRSAFFGSKHSTPSEAFYSVQFHELTHWTGAKHRLNREMGKRFGDEAYAMEELVAELGAAFLCAEFGMASSPREDHAAYIGHWLKVLKSDTRAVLVAAREARKASEFLRHPR